jgi:hypothetical protein
MRHHLPQVIPQVNWALARTGFFLMDSGGKLLISPQRKLSDPVSLNQQ